MEMDQEKPIVRAIAGRPLDFELDAAQARVLGCLIEKERTTPDAYPLSINALVAACNQKTNRNPVVSFTNAETIMALSVLREKQLALMSPVPNSRVNKYRHFITEKYRLSEGQSAVLCELLLRGPQTPGELRAHAGRMYSFDAGDSVEKILAGLCSGEDGAWAVQLPRQPGQKENRFMHRLMGDAPAGGAFDPAPLLHGQGSGGGGARAGGVDAGRVERLEGEVSELRAELAALRAAFEAFQAQFG